MHKITLKPHYHHLTTTQQSTEQKLPYHSSVTACKALEYHLVSTKCVSCAQIVQIVKCLKWYYKCIRSPQWKKNTTKIPLKGCKSKHKFKLINKYSDITNLAVNKSITLQSAICVNLKPISLMFNLL